MNKLLPGDYLLNVGGRYCDLLVISCQAEFGYVYCRYIYPAHTWRPPGVAEELICKFSASALLSDIAAGTCLKFSMLEDHDAC
jgi:hypothetical protein